MPSPPLPLSDKQGQDIHVQRRMVNCTFLDGGCEGMVQERFQQAFEEVRRGLTSEVMCSLDPEFPLTPTHTYIPSPSPHKTKLIATCWDHVGPLKDKTVLVMGHSLGGGLSIFMAIKLWKDLQTLPALTFGWAGPFIG